MRERERDRNCAAINYIIGSKSILHYERRSRERLFSACVLCRYIIIISSSYSCNGERERGRVVGTLLVVKKLNNNHNIKICQSHGDDEPRGLYYILSSRVSLQQIDSYIYIYN